MASHINKQYSNDNVNEKYKWRNDNESNIQWYQWNVILKKARMIMIMMKILLILIYS